MERKSSKLIIPILMVLLILSLICSWTLFKKTEAMHYAADEAIGYGLKGLSHELNCTLQNLGELKAYGALEPEKFSLLCEQLDRDVFYSVETMAAFDYGLLSAGYNDYDIFWFYCYINDVFRASKNFDKMSTAESRQFTCPCLKSAVHSISWTGIYRSQIIIPVYRWKHMILRRIHRACESIWKN